MPPKRKFKDAQDAKPSKRKLNDGSTHVTPGWESWKNSAKNPNWASTVSSGPNGKAVVAKYCLLPPYDSNITESEWKQYLNERTDLDKLNSLNSTHERAHYLLYCEELGGDFVSPLKSAFDASCQLAAEILGSTMDEAEKLLLSRTLRGSIYLLQVEGDMNGDGEPDAVDIKVRLYAPHGLGKSIDFEYSYDEHDIHLIAFIRTIEACGNSGMKPYESWTKIRHPKSLNWKERPGSIKIFKCAGKKSHKGTTIANMQELENVILGREGVLSASKLFKVLCAACTIGTWDESQPRYHIRDSLAKVTEKCYKATLLSETDGSEQAKEEVASLDVGNLKFDDPGMEENAEEISVPLELLQLAKSSTVEA